MELDTETLLVPHIDLDRGKKSLVGTLVALPVIRNVTAVEKGAILTLAWTTPCDVDDYEC